MATSTTRRGGEMATTGVERRAQRARQEPHTRYTALMHHFTVGNLRAGFESLDGKKATGGNGVTKALYGQPLEDNLQALHRKRHQRAYRPQPVRRVEMPKDNGGTRPLGISCLEDKIVQEMARHSLEAIYEPVLLDTSYGCRPGRSCHEALRQLNDEVMRAPVNSIADLELARFFETMPHVESLAGLAERLADQAFLRLIARMLKAGVQTPGGVVYDALGSPQGSLVSPVIANAFLDHVLDQWFVQTVRQHCRGYCALIRSADNALVVFEHGQDAQRFMRVLPKRLGKLGVCLNHEKTHLLAFGTQQAWQVFREGTPLLTFDYLGFTHSWGRSRTGKARLKRKTSKKRVRRALVEINAWLRQERNPRKLPDLWQAGAGKIRGHLTSCGVTDNSHALKQFRMAVRRLRFKWLNRRSQRRSFTWAGFLRYEARSPLPRPTRVVPLIPRWSRTV